MENCVKVTHGKADNGCRILGAAPVRGPVQDEYRVSTVVARAIPLGYLAPSAGPSSWAERTDGRITMQIYPGAQLVQGEQTRCNSRPCACGSIVIDIGGGVLTINCHADRRTEPSSRLPFLIARLRGRSYALTQGPVGRADLRAVIQGNGPVVPLGLGWRTVSARLTNSARARSAPRRTWTG